MIKTIQLLKESFTTYKLNFKNIFNMTWPIVLLTVIAQYYSIGITSRLEAKQYDIPYFITASVIYFVCILIVGLFLAPALNRSVQKNEDNGVFDVKEGYSFQKKNIWKFVMVNIWGFLYFIKRAWFLIIPAMVMFSVTLQVGVDLTTGVYSMLGGILLLFIVVILNITRFMFYKSIFFSKDAVSAKDAVKESMSLGVTRMNDIWRIILAVIVAALAMEIILKILSMFIFSTLLGLIVGSFLMIMFSLPFILIVVSKGYTKVRVGDVVEVV